MATIWISADFHFDHAALIERTPGFLTSPLRGRFKHVDEMNEFIVDQWNSRVRTKDKGYILGDLTMRKRGLHWVKRLHGQLRMVGGNHDEEDMEAYKEAGIEAIYGCRVLANVILTHIPIHPGSLSRFLGNAHGHLHDLPAPLGQYINMSVEQHDYAPLTLEQVVERLTKLKEQTALSLTREMPPLTHRMQMPESVKSGNKMTPRHGGDTTEEDAIGRALSNVGLWPPGAKP